MTGITKAFVKRRFDLWATELGLKQTTWRQVERTSTHHGNECTVRTVGLDYYRGWHVECTTNDRGGITVLNGSRMTNTELLAWFEGSLWLANKIGFDGVVKL